MLLSVLVLDSGDLSYLQHADCKATKAEISGTYVGGCKKGLVHGNGIAQGIDRYEGQFIKGLPSGKEFTDGPAKFTLNAISLLSLKYKTMFINFSG